LWRIPTIVSFLNPIAVTPPASADDEVYPFLTLAIASRDHVHGIEAVVQLLPKLPFAAEFWLCDGV